MAPYSLICCTTFDQGPCDIGVGVLLPWLIPSMLLKRLPVVSMSPNYSFLLTKHTLDDSSKICVAKPLGTVYYFSIIVYFMLSEEVCYVAINRMGIKWVVTCPYLT